MINASDIYNISEFVNNVQKKYMEDVSEDTLSMGIFGYLNDINSSAIQNAIITAAEWGNEAIPTRSKFEKTILTNAITYDIKDINAVPAKMQVMMGFIKKEIDELLDEYDKGFTIDKDSPIYVEDYEFHLDYDLFITRTKLPEGGYTYAARYIMDRKNPISTVINPYLQSPFIITVDNSKFLFITITLRQVELNTEYKKIISKNILENKAFEFTFKDQLASFDIIVKEDGVDKYIKPVFEGLPPMGATDYCFYTYIDANTIRVKFDRKVYEPKLNCDITINIKTTRGSEGNFKYKDDILSNVITKTVSSISLNTLIRPVTDSYMGIDRKSVSELKDMIPKEILSRGNIINNKDLENFFNMIDDNNKIYLFRKRDNQFERLYYAYLIAKNNINNIVPTNTLDVNVTDSDFDAFNDTRYIIHPGRVFVYEDGKAKLLPNRERNVEELEKDNFVYTSPFLIAVNKNPLSASFYLTTVDRTYDFNYSYINNTSDLQFISHKMNIYRNYLEDNKYKISLTMLQNIDVDRNLVKTDSDGNVTESLIKPVLIIENGNHKYYKFGNIVSVSRGVFSYDVEFNLDTDNLIDRENRIKIKDVYQNGTDTKVDVFLSETTTMHVAVYIPEEYASFKEVDFINIPSLEGYTCTNRYTAMDDVNLFYNYSHIMNCTTLVNKDAESEGNNFIIRGIPLVKYSYLNDVDRCNELVDFIQYRKAYIDSALEVLENSFGIDFKFFNTYGPSKTFNIGYNKEKIDRVNITLKFIIKTIPGSDKKINEYIISEIKDYMENINNLVDMHMSNLTAHIKNKFKSDIEFIEFVNINEYDSTYQYLDREEPKIIEEVPEFLTINLKDNVNPDIEIVTL